MLVEMTLNNPTCPGCGSSSDLSLISPYVFYSRRSVSRSDSFCYSHEFNVETSIRYGHTNPPAKTRV